MSVSGWLSSYLHRQNEIVPLDLRTAVEVTSAHMYTTSHIYTNSNSSPSLASPTSRPPASPTMRFDYNMSIHDIPYSIRGVNSNRAAFVVPRRAYFYNRAPEEPRNMFVILAEVHDAAVDTIVACEINGKLLGVKTTTDNTVTGWIRYHRSRRIYTHRLLVVQCLDYPDNLITGGSITKLIYWKRGDDFYSRVETEKPLVVTYDGRDSSMPSQGKGSIVACTTAYNHPERLHDWLKYQKTLGIDLVHINADVSFEENATNIYPFLKESLDNGFARMEVWNHVVDRRNYNYGQMLKYQDCLYRYKGIYEYGIFGDFDDFFNPMLPDHKDIHFYMNEFFSSSKIATVCFDWRQLACKPLDELHKTLTDGNLTKILSGPYSTWWSKKCVHRLNGVKVIGIHGAEEFLKGYSTHVHRANRSLAYMAHNRINNDICKL